MKVRELLTGPEKWTKGRFARNKEGEVSSFYSCDACCWCLIGAIYKCYNERIVDDILGKVLKYINRINFSSIPVFNDCPTTSFQDIRKLVESLDV